jgi:hypothetical protein
VPPVLIEMLAAHITRSGRDGVDDLLFVAPEGGSLRRST